MKKTLVLFAATLLLAATAAQASDKARIAVIGDLDTLYVGQAGYCGERTWVERKAWQGIFVDGGERTWLHMNAKLRTPTLWYDCKGEYSFVPQREKAYIVRYSIAGEQCHFHLFRVVPGGDPVPEELTHEQSRSCLAK
ncbi:MAG: hypothetical protein V4858_13850 [Pseudomonadota bacterium]